MSKLRFGAYLPNRGILFDKPPATHLIYEMAQEAEASGYDSVWVGHSVTAKPRLEAWTTLAAVAGLTKKVRLGTACFMAGLWNPVLLANTIATLDILSNGRTVPVVCLGGGRAKRGTGGGFGGYLNEEYKSCGAPTENKGALLEEIIVLLRKLWTESDVSYAGQFFTLNNITLDPITPVQKPCPPIWIANNPSGIGLKSEMAQKSLKRVAKFADGWMNTICAPQQFAESWKAIQQEARNERRDPNNIETCMYFTMNVNDDRSKAYESGCNFLNSYYYGDFKPDSSLDRWGAFGTADDIIKRMQLFMDAGARTLVLRYAATNDDQMNQLKRVSREIMPSFR